MIRPAITSDAIAIAKIYNYYISHSLATFEEIEINAEEMASRILSVSQKLPWLIYEESNEILGYAYATLWKPRSAYRNTVESTVYVKPNAFKKGIGKLLYNELINRLKALEHHAVLAGITLPNEASVALHEKLGFVKVGQLKEVGNKFGKWVDVGYWELLLK